MKNHCSELYFLSTIACQLSSCLTKEELELLAAQLKALGELLEVLSIQQSSCENSCENYQ